MRTTEDIMECVPSRLCEHETDLSTDRIIVLRPKYTSKLGRSVFEPFLKNKNFKVKLDDLGTAVWKNMDGKNTVKNLGEILAAEFGPEIEPIYERLGKFIIQMHKEKFIRLDCPQKNVM